jgi:hypothetical protein
LQWAAEQRCVLVTHDVQTVMRFAYVRVEAGLPMSGVIEVISSAPIGSLVEELALVVECYEDGDLEGQVIYLPL